MNEHTIDNFMKLASKGNSSDTYYRSKYNEILLGKKFTFNWCSFLFNISWLLYRKMYLYGVLWSVFQSAYAACIMYFFYDMVNAVSADGLRIFFKISILMLGFVPSIFLGFIGNWLYVQQIHKKIDLGYHFSNIKNIDKLTWVLSAVFVLFCTVGGVVVYGSSAITAGGMRFVPTVLNVLFISALGFIRVMYDKKAVKAALTTQTLSAESVVYEEKV